MILVAMIVAGLAGFAVFAYRSNRTDLVSRSSSTCSNGATNYPSCNNNSYLFTVTADGASCNYGQVNWGGKITVDGSAFNYEGCGTQSWQFTGKSISVSFDNVGCGNGDCIGSYQGAFDLRVTILKDGSACWAQNTSAYTTITGNC